MPWLRSKGNSLRVIDTQITLRQRMASLAPRWRYAIQQRKLTPYCLIYERPDYTGDNKGGLRPATPTYQALVSAARQSTEQGFFCFDEMFVWANDLLRRPRRVGSGSKRVIRRDGSGVRSERRRHEKSRSAYGCSRISAASSSCRLAS